MIIDLSFKKMFVSLIAISFLMGTPEGVFAGGGNNNQGKKEKRTVPDRATGMLFRSPNQEATPPVPVAPLLSGASLDKFLATAEPFGAPLVPNNTGNAAIKASNVVWNFSEMGDALVGPFPEVAVKVKPAFLRIQHCEPLTQTQIIALADDAHRGDIKAQDQLVQRNYLAILNRENIANNWGIYCCSPLALGDQAMSPLSWNNVLGRAIQDPLYAYTLINAYDYVLNKYNNGSLLTANKSILEKIPELIKELQIQAEAEDPDAQFNLGLLYHNLRAWPQYLGLKLKLGSGEIGKLSHQMLQKAAAQGHPHAHIVLGANCYMGHSPEATNGRNSVGAIRWFLPIKNLKTSKDFLRAILVKGPYNPQEKGTFHEELAGIECLLERVKAHHMGQIELHNPDGNYSEHKFTIPELGELYKKIVATKDETRELLLSLNQSTPGFMLKNAAINGGKKHDLERQTEPHFVAMHDINDVKYLTIGEKNVALATSLLAYVEKIDEKFKEAEKTLKRIGKRYKLVLESASGELMTRRLFALQNKDEDSTLKFVQQKKYVDELELHVRPQLAKIKDERADLKGVKEHIRNLVTSTADKRNRDFEVYLDLR